jgi:hypothetical protein
MLTVQHSGRDVLVIAGLKVAGSHNEDRYVYSERFAHARQYWATVTPRSSLDHFGIQFVGKAGEREASRYEAALEAAGFSRRRDSRANVTFARPIKFRSDGQSDAEAIRTAKRQLDEILTRTTSLSGALSSEESPIHLIKAIRESIPFFVDLELPPRDLESEREISF